MIRWGICFGPAWGSSIADLTAAAASCRGPWVRPDRGRRIPQRRPHVDARVWQARPAPSGVATTIVNIALRHPAVTAEAVAGVRDLHGDRIDLGLGISHLRIVGEQLGGELPRLADLAEYAAAVRATLEGLPFAGQPVACRTRSAPATESVPVRSRSSPPSSG